MAVHCSLICVRSINIVDAGLNENYAIATFLIGARRHLIILFILISDHIRTQPAVKLKPASETFTGQVTSVFITNV